jgi:ketosteroid isomerase-like protein
MKSLSLNFFTLALVALTPLVSVAQNPSTAEIKRVYDAVATATDQHDVAAFERLLTDDFVFIARNGQVFDRKTYLARQQVGQMLAGVKPEITDIRIYGDTALVTSRAVLPTQSGISTDVFVKQNGTWKWASFQATLVVAGNAAQK